MYVSTHACVPAGFPSLPTTHSVPRIFEVPAGAVQNPARLPGRGEEGGEGAEGNSHRRPAIQAGIAVAPRRERASPIFRSAVGLPVGSWSMGQSERALLEGASWMPAGPPGTPCDREGRTRSCMEENIHMRARNVAHF